MNDPQKVRLGVIGAGMFAEVGHLPGLLCHPAAQVVAVCARRLQSARALADRFGIPEATDDVSRLCARADIDAITIASANVAHAEHAITALRSGKHVLCEKPLAVTVEQAREMTRIAEESGKVHQVAFTFRYNYGIAELRKRVAAGDIGTPFYARVQYDRWDALSIDPESGWHTKKHLNSAGMLFDMGSHLFDITRHVLGPLESVIGFTHSIPTGPSDEMPAAGAEFQEPEDLVNTWYRHACGLKGQFFVSRITPPFAPLGTFEVIGRDGALKASLSRGGVDSLKISTPEAPRWTHLPLASEASDGKPHALRRMMHSFVDACLRGALHPETDASFHDGLAAQIAMSALLESQRSERWIHLSELE